MANGVSSTTFENTINRQVKDILRITGQNEVIQSFVRSDMTQDSEETLREGAKTAMKEKKTSGIGWKSGDAGVNNNVNVERSKDQKEDPNAKTTIQLYQQLGKDAQWSSKDIGKKSGSKWSRRQRLIEEVYTDKDRAAAVNLGSRDIKQSLKLKRRQDRTRILEISEEAHPGTLLALAIHRFKSGDIYVAMKFVNKVADLIYYLTITHNPSELWPYYSKHYCFLKIFL